MSPIIWETCQRTNLTKSKIRKKACQSEASQQRHIVRSQRKPSSEKWWTQVYPTSTCHQKLAISAKIPHERNLRQPGRCYLYQLDLGHKSCSFKFNDYHSSSRCWRLKTLRRAFLEILHIRRTQVSPNMEFQSKRNNQSYPANEYWKEVTYG